MSDDNKQPVVDPANAAAMPAAAADDSARNKVDDLDALLAEFDQSTKTTATVSPPDTKTNPQPDPVLADEVKALRAELRADKDRKAINTAIDEIRGDIPQDVFDDEMVEAWLDAQARRDPRLAQAWAQREANPRQWGKVQAELGKRLASRFDKLPDKSVTDDRAAVAAAVRGASTRVAAEPAPNMGRMSNAEYRKSVQEQYGFDPGV